MCIPLHVGEYDKSTKEVTVLLRGLAFANGVALSKDKSIVLVAENSTGKIVRWQAHVTAIKLSEDGQVLEVLEDFESKTLECISEVEDKNDWFSQWINLFLQVFPGQTTQQFKINIFNFLEPKVWPYELLVPILSFRDELSIWQKKTKNANQIKVQLKCKLRAKIEVVYRAVEKLIFDRSTGGRRTHWSLIGGDCGRVLVVCGRSHW
ncbi:hypothetical protein FXO37_23702 [Capsicum annuum]|nr:hypothetical protein FXO37_23702 [Capsicum annuum]